MKALLKNYRQQPRKVRLLADLIRGKKVKDAFAALGGAEKRAAGPMEKVLRSAVANAVNEGKREERLYIKGVTVDKGITYKRFMPRARGAASPIRKRTSNIKIALEEKS